ncbi:metallophosphoesterase family protein [Azospirillum sp. TSH100]|uniref:metallophosphoesterase family protein n=1 Tax=Azospirillum sp. TSH100 TaxID=652764 RepID=UPI001FFF6974|nr:metallophosphoesterase family protein [Azospirillum sp. TSH100]
MPDDVLVYAIGDIHGCLGQLDRLLDRVRADADRSSAAGQRWLIFLGDYIDRGPDSAGVVDRLASLSLPGFSTRCLIGNHEQAMLEFLRDPVSGRDWLRFGGVATLASYGIANLHDLDGAASLLSLHDALCRRLPSSHRRFLETLEPMAIVGDYAFVHAGIRPSIPLADQTEHDLCWIRDSFLGFAGPHEKRIVHGHSISPFPEVRNNRIGIDTGAYAGGPLTSVVLCGMTIRFIQVRANELRDMEALTAAGT